MTGQKMKLLVSIVVLIVMLMLTASFAFAQEFSGIESRWMTRTFYDFNENGQIDSGEEVVGVDIYVGFVQGTTCSSVPEGTQFTWTDKFKTPFFTAAGLGCYYFSLSADISTSNYDAIHTSIDSQNLAPDVLISLGSESIYMPLVMRAWSGQ